MGNNNSISTNKLKQTNKDKQINIKEMKQSINKLIHNNKDKTNPMTNTLFSNAFNGNTKEPYPKFRINTSNIYSILDMSHQITNDHLIKDNFHSNNSIYSSALLYSNKDIEVNKKILNTLILSKPMMLPNLLNTSLTRDNVNTTLRSNYLTSISVSEDIEHVNQKFKLKNANHMIKKHSSCEDLNFTLNKKKAFKEKQNELEITMDDKTIIIGKEYKESIVIKEENENTAYDYLLRNRVPLNQLKANRIKGYKELNKSDRLKYTVTFSDNIRKHNQRDAANTNNNNEASSGVKDKNNEALRHGHSFFNFLLENMCNINEQEELIENEKEKKLTKKAITERENKIPYKVNLKTMQKILICKGNTNKKSQSKPNKMNQQSKSPIKHKRFISIMEHYMDIDPNNRSTVIKAKINQQKQYYLPQRNQVFINELKTDSSSRQEECKDKDTLNYSNLKSEDSSTYVKEHKKNYYAQYLYHHNFVSSGISGMLSTEPTPKQDKLRGFSNK